MKPTIDSEIVMAKKDTAIVFYCKVCGGLMFAAVNGEHIKDSADDISRCIKEEHRMAEISVEAVRTSKWCSCNGESDENN